MVHGHLTTGVLRVMHTVARLFQWQCLRSWRPGAGCHNGRMSISLLGKCHAHVETCLQLEQANVTAAFVRGSIFACGGGVDVGPRWWGALRLWSLPVRLGTLARESIFTQGGCEARGCVRSRLDQTADGMAKPEKPGWTALAMVTLVSDVGGGTHMTWCGEGEK